MSNHRSAFVLPKLYAITDARLSGMSHVAQVEALCAGGARLIQLRDKQLPAYEFCEQARQSRTIARRYQAKLIINDRIDVALAIESDGVHLGQDDLPVGAARHLLPQTAIIGFSTHNLIQAEAASKLPIDYLAVGPIFSTQTKTDPDPVLGLEALAQIRHRIGRLPLVAIGGITLENAAGVLEAGADSVAMVSALVSDPARIEERVALFLRAVI
jgi:thiamine-phosphate pyrophosphorylase